MKANELFIGAWVEYKGTHHKILGIHKDDSGDYRDQIDDEFKQWYLLSEFKSIPITAEILEHNGFCKDGLPRYGLVIDKIPLFVFHYKDDVWKVICELDLTRPCVNRIRFVHELQMCLLLNRIDKEIAL